LVIGFLNLVSVDAKERSFESKKKIEKRIFAFAYLVLSTLRRLAKAFGYQSI